MKHKMMACLLETMCCILASRRRIKGLKSMWSSNTLQRQLMLVFQYVTCLNLCNVIHAQVHEHNPLMLCCTVHLRGQIDTIYTRAQPQLLCNKALQIAEMIDFEKSQLIYCLLGLCGKSKASKQCPQDSYKAPHYPLTPIPQSCRHPAFSPH